VHSDRRRDLYATSRDRAGFARSMGTTSRKPERCAPPDRAYRYGPIDSLVAFVHDATMEPISVWGAQTTLSRLIRGVAASEEVVINRSGRPVARLVPTEPLTRGVIGIDAGKYAAPAGFNDPIAKDGSELFGP